MLKSPKPFKGVVKDDPALMTCKQLEKFNSWIQQELKYLSETDGKVTAYDRACANYEKYIVEFQGRKLGQ